MHRSYRVRTLLFNIETVVLPPRDELDATTTTICSTFRARHLERCKENILGDRRLASGSCLLYIVKPCPSIKTKLAFPNENLGLFTNTEVHGKSGLEVTFIREVPLPQW